MADFLTNLSILIILSAFIHQTNTHSVKIPWRSGRPGRSETSRCIRNLDDILPSSCRERVRNDFSYCRRDLNDQDLFESCCEECSSGFELIRSEFDDSHELIVSLNVIFIRLLKQNEDVHSLKHIRSLIQIVKQVIRHTPNRLQIFLEGVSFNPEYFKFLLLELHEVWDEDCTQGNEHQVVKLILNLTKLTKLLAEKRVSDCQLTIISIFKLRTKNVRIATLLSSYLVNLVRTIKGGREELVQLITVIVNFVNSFVSLTIEDCEVVLEEILIAIVDIGNSCGAEDSEENVNVFLKFVLLLFRSYGSIVLDFVQLVQKFRCH